MTQYSKPMAAIFLTLVFGVSVAEAETTEQEFDNWTVRHIEDPLDDTNRYIAYVENSAGDAVFMFKCDEAGSSDLSDPYAEFYKSRTYFGDDDRTEVRYRIDDNPVQEESWNLAESSVINLDKSEVLSLSQKLKSGIKFILEARDYDYDTHRGTFSLDGSNEAISRVFEGCAGE